MFAFLLHRYHVVQANHHEAKRLRTCSPDWKRTAYEHLRANPFCAGCRSVLFTRVHHIKPVSVQPTLELKPSNLLTLCMDQMECHLRIGHGGDFSAYNPNVVLDAKLSREQPAYREEIWKSAKLSRLY